MSCSRPRPVPRAPRNPEAGAAFILVVTLLAALLAGGAAVVLLSNTQVRSAGEGRRALDATYCAETGLMETRDIVAAVPDEWDTLLGGSPSGSITIYPIVGDIDGDGENDYSVTIRDNDDEAVPDGTVDTDNRVFLVSTCIRYDEVSREIIELINVTTTLGDTYDQAGQGAGGTGNIN